MKDTTCLGLCFFHVEAAGRLGKTAVAKRSPVGMQGTGDASVLQEKGQARQEAG